MSKELEQKAREIADGWQMMSAKGMTIGDCLNSCAKEALQLKQKEVDKYKPYYDGVIDQCAVNHLPEQDTPYNTINMLCCWEADIALDPKVSERVAELHDKIASLQERIKELEVSGAQLASWQCPYDDGVTGLTSDDYGHQYCNKDRQLKALQERCERLEKIVNTQQLELHHHFPNLYKRPKTPTKTKGGAA